MRVPSNMDRWPVLVKLQSHLLAIRVNSEELYQSRNPDGLPLAVAASRRILASFKPYEKPSFSRPL